METILGLSLSYQFFSDVGKTVHGQLIYYLISKKVLTPNQSAFLKLYSTITFLINGADYL